MTETVDKFDSRSQDIAQDKRQELLRLFPEIRTGADKFDFDRPSGSRKALRFWT
jgi:adenine-specific DNA-methyltransferase